MNVLKSGGDMLAARYHGPEDLRVEKVPRPEIHPDELLLRVKSASICGTDLRIFHGNHRKYPPSTVRIPGHEVVGEIAEIGAGLQGFKVGQRVFVAPNIGCGYCRQCISGNNNLCENYEAIGVTLDGGFAEYMRVPAQAILQGNVMPIQDNIDPAAASLIEPFACVLRGQTAIQIHPGDFVLIMGAGPIGIMHAMLARLSGASRIMISEPIAERLEHVTKIGVDYVVNPAVEDLAEALVKPKECDGADTIIVAAPSHQAQESALKLAGIRGRINFFGGLPKDNPTIRFDSNLMHYKELVVTATTACSTGDCLRAAEIINSGRIDLGSLISHRFPLERTADAFITAEGRKALKIVIQSDLFNKQE